MKKKHVKELRRIQSELPVIERAAIVKERVKGSELILRGTTEVEGKKVVPGNYYLVKSYGPPIPMNHKNSMKKLFKSHGLLGVRSYINAVEAYVEKKKAETAPAEVVTKH